MDYEGRFTGMSTIPPRDPKWGQDTPDQQMAAIVQSAWNHATSAKEGIIPADVAVERLLAHIEELQRLNRCMQGQTRWKD